MPRRRTPCARRVAGIATALSSTSADFLPMLPVAVDAMGGDDAPGPILAGAHRAAASGIPVVLVGPADLDGRVAPDGSVLDLIEASEVIGMHDDPAQGVRRKKDSTLVRAAEAVRDGKASAMISAGNTGATMAAALLRMGRISGVKRPAVATPIPVPGAKPTVLLDAGANSEVQAEWLVQFALMGSVYAHHRFGIESPRVGLLSIGEEPGKGDSLRKETYELLCDASHLNFVGNVEGRDVMSADLDVCVTDGFTGNVVLKSLEGGMRAIVNAILEAFASEEHYKPHADALMPALLSLYQTLSPDTYGGAVLLGVDGVCIISHGSSGETAIANGIGVARDMVEHDMVGEIRAAIAGNMA
ncbi:MAG TPA: phosphate acyltransferase PlsX [Ilumatobacteraceae bacterium]|nr:phosphate acyltransferase PlsX [Ilumatobacteraceae bacterium]